MLLLTTIDEPLQRFSSTWVQLLIIVILILVNAFFASSELAILSANPRKLDFLIEKQNKKAKLVKKLKENDTKFLSTIQVGITLAGFFSSATAAVSLSEGLGQKITSLNVPFGSQIALVLVTLILSYFTLVFGELLPKRIALRNPEGIAMSFSPIINVIRIIFSPIVFLLSASCELIVRILGLKPKKEDKVTEAEIKALISSGVKDGTIDKDDETLINSIFTFGDLKAADVMTPRIKVSMIDIEDNIRSIKKQIKEEKYTRMPVYEKDKDNIIGILNIKDLLLTLDNNFTNKDIQSVLRKPLFVSESKPADDVFRMLQKSNSQACLVVSELGSVIGFLTMEDLIEEVMGDIEDEYDEKIEQVTKINDNTYLIDGQIPLQDLDKKLNLAIKQEHDDFSTLAGLLFDKLETIPTEGIVYQLNDQITLEVVKVENNQIKLIKLTITK